MNVTDKFYRWLHERIMRAIRNERNDGDALGGEIRRKKRDTAAWQSWGDKIDDRGMRFSLHRANGGWVIEYIHYDETKDEEKTRLHLVPEGKSLGDAFEQVVTFEHLRN